MDVSSSVVMIENGLNVVTPTINVIVVVILLLLIGFIGGKLVSRLVFWFLRSVNADGFLRRVFHTSVSFSKGLSSALAVIIYIGTVFFVLYTLHIIKAVLLIVVCLIGLFLLLSLIFSLGEFIPNFFSGFSVRSHLMPGDSLTWGKGIAIVERVGLLHTVLRLKNGEVLLMPHLGMREVVKKKMPQHRGRY
jgi:hypothetical protein